MASVDGSTGVDFRPWHARKEANRRLSCGGQRLELGTPDHPAFCADLSAKGQRLPDHFFWKKTRRNPWHRKVTRKTNPKKFRNSLKSMKEWLKKARSLPLPDIIATLKRKLTGYWNYYGVIGNPEAITRYYHEVQKLVYKWLNRRSQRKSFTGSAFGAAWERWAMPAPKIRELRPA